jgi:hypothetical protein
MQRYFIVPPSWLEKSSANSRSGYRQIDIPGRTCFLGGSRYQPFFASRYGILSFAAGKERAGYGPILATVYSLAQKSGGPSLSATLWLEGFTPRLRYAAMAHRSWSDMWRHEGQGIGRARYLGVAGKFPTPGVVEVMVTSGVSPGRKPYRKALNI